MPIHPARSSMPVKVTEHHCQVDVAHLFEIVALRPGTQAYSRSSQRPVLVSTTELIFCLAVSGELRLNSSSCSKDAIFSEENRGGDGTHFHRK